MMEEKMKNLELKSQRVEVINEFFFDMFENNLVKEELKRQKNADKEEKDKNQENEELETDRKRKKKKSKKNKKNNLNIEINNQNKENQEDLEHEFKKKTKNFSNNYLKTVKNNIGISLVEEQINKKEELQNMIEDIVELKGDLIDKLERVQMEQNLQMKKMAYCLQNSGDIYIENLANRIFKDNLLKDYNYPTTINNSNVGDNGSVQSPRNSIYKPRDSIFKGRGSIFKERDSIFKERGSLLNPSDTLLNMNRKNSILSTADNKNNNTSRRHSLFAKEKNNEGNKNNKRQSFLNIVNKSRKQSILEKEDIGGRLPRKSIKIIPEEKNENDN